MMSAIGYLVLGLASLVAGFWVLRTKLPNPSLRQWTLIAGALLGPLCLSLGAPSLGPLGGTWVSSLVEAALGAGTAGLITAGAIVGLERRHTKALSKTNEREVSEHEQDWLRGRGLEADLRSHRALIPKLQLEQSQREEARQRLEELLAGQDRSPEQRQEAHARIQEAQALVIQSKRAIITLQTQLERATLESVFQVLVRNLEYQANNAGTTDAPFARLETLESAFEVLRHAILQHHTVGDSIPDAIETLAVHKHRPGSDTLPATWKRRPRLLEGSDELADRVHKTLQELRALRADRKLQAAVALLDQGETRDEGLEGAVQSISALSDARAESAPILPKESLIAHHAETQEGLAEAILDAVAALHELDKLDERDEELPA